MNWSKERIDSFSKEGDELGDRVRAIHAAYYATIKARHVARKVATQSMNTLWRLLCVKQFARDPLARLGGNQVVDESTQ